MAIFESQLKDIGLTKTQAAVLDFLLENGESKAGIIAKNTPHPRGVVYKALEELLKLNLIEKLEPSKKVAFFRAQNPRNLEKVLEEKENRARRSQKIYEGILPQMISRYNLALNKPGVIFYEGEDGLRKILEDTLKSRTEILLFLNKEALNREEGFREINEEYKKKRERAGIKKKIIRVGKKPENTFLESRPGQYDQLTEIRYLEKDLPDFMSSLQIYDNKISYQSFEQGNLISILVEDKNIYAMNKALFDVVWSSCQK